MQDDINLLTIMSKDQNKQEGLYRPGPYWKGYCSRTSKAIKSHGLENFRTNSMISKGYADSMVLSPLDQFSGQTIKQRIYKKIVEFAPIKKYLFDPQLKYTESYFRQSQQYKDFYYTNKLSAWLSQALQTYSLPNTLVGNPQDVVSIDDNIIAKSYLDSLIRISNLSKNIDFSKIQTVFEIGGGFGAFSHTLLHNFPNIKKYIYLDIPPILYVGTQYLKHFYGDQVKDYRLTKDLEKIKFSSSDEREIIAICPWQIDKLDVDVDFVWNSSSFQEMPEDIVLNYSQHIKRLLADDTSNLCLYIYKEEAPENSLSSNDLLQIIEENSSVMFKELSPEIEITDAQYFLGRRKSL
jgi:putative sugar O-methyltransferase